MFWESFWGVRWTSCLSPAESRSRNVTQLQIFFSLTLTRQVSHGESWWVMLCRELCNWGPVTYIIKTHLVFWQTVSAGRELTVQWFCTLNIKKSYTPCESVTAERSYMQTWIRLMKQKADSLMMPWKKVVNCSYCRPLYYIRRTFTFQIYQTSSI